MMSTPEMLKIPAQDFFVKFLSAYHNLSAEQVREILKNLPDYAFDAVAGKFYKIADSHFKTVTDTDELNAALDDGWEFDKVLNFGKLPTKIQVCKKAYLDASHSLTS